MYSEEVEATSKLGIATETKTIEKVLDHTIAEEDRNRAAREANERFMKSGIVVRDVFGRLEGTCDAPQS
jgi:hypothetical protein